MIRPPAKTTPASDERKILWDDSNARSVYSDVSAVSATREEISLLFGTSRLPEKWEEGITVQATDRIVLNPLIAKKLAAELNDCIRYYESQLGRIDEPSSPLADLGEGILSGQRWPSPPKEIGSGKAAALLELIEELKVELSIERSVKLAEKSLLGNRFLVVVNKKLVKEKPNERILEICEKMAMPRELLDTFSQNLHDADYVYFGFEENEKTSMYKAYLESPEYWTRVTPNSPYGSEPFQLYEGFKWDTLDSKKRVLTSYTCYPCITLESIFQRLSSLYEDPMLRDSLEITKAILETASKRTGHENLVYLEVSEGDNPRKSFDISMYKAKLLLEDLFPLLLEMGRRFSIASERLYALFDPVRAERFGHLSGGIGREGQEFLTVYYGVERSPKA